MHIVLRQKAAIHLVILVQADCHHLDVRKLLLHRQQTRKLLNTRRTPRSPEIQNDNLAPKFRKVNRLDPIGHSELRSQSPKVFGVGTPLAAGQQ